MIEKIKRWWRTRGTELPERQEVYSREEVLEIVAEQRRVAYNDGKRDGLAIAREQATKSLKEILWEQNQQKTKPRTQ